MGGFEGVRKACCLIRALRHGRIGLAFSSAEAKVIAAQMDACQQLWVHQLPLLEDFNAAQSNE
jgi:hypothetical protein